MARRGWFTLTWTVTKPMRWGEIGWLMCLAGLPVSLMLGREICHLQLDLWHMQTAWMQGWIIVLWAGLMDEGRHFPKSIPLMELITWIGLCAWWGNMETSSMTQKYAVGLLMPLWHLMFIVMAYQAAVGWWTVRTLTAIFTVLAWTGLLSVVYAAVQSMNMDQFFHEANTVGHGADLMVGLLGNQTHFAAYLSFLMPIWLFREGWGWKVTAAMALLCLVVLHSSIALLAAGVTLAVWGWHQRWRVPFLTVLGLGAMVVVWTQHAELVSLHGRGLVWTEAWAMLQRGHAITGFGPGFLIQFVKGLPPEHLLHGWTHLHNEFLQSWLEFGLIGLALIGWLLAEVGTRWKILPASNTRTILGLMGLSVLLNSLVNFPAHLWALGSFGLIAWAGITVLHDAEGVAAANP